MCSPVQGYYLDDNQVQDQLGPDFLFNYNHQGDVIYDIETYPNVITLSFYHTITFTKLNFEISNRKNEHWLLCSFLERCMDLKIRLVGFKNISFDYLILHFIYENRNFHIEAIHIYEKAKSIIESKSIWGNLIPEWNHIIPQLDLFKIHHFDNKAKFTGLKVLEFNMRMKIVKGLPFEPGSYLSNDQIDELHTYNDDDIYATFEFYKFSEADIKLRKELSEIYNTNFANDNMVKIGEKILIHEMEQRGIKCYDWIDGRKTKRQTPRDCIKLNDVIFPYIRFEMSEFKNIENKFRNKTITETKGSLEDLRITFADFYCKFGLGGLHGSVSSQAFVSNDKYQIIDIDAASYYAQLAVKNKVYPEHLGPIFYETLEDIAIMRSQHDKDTSINKALKESLTGVFGLSNLEFSVLYDPLYTMTITVNGQLLLCMLIEQLLKIPKLKMIQANTDGLTFFCPVEYVEHARSLYSWWQDFTHLKLEETLYSRMFVNNVNSYLAIKNDGTIKRIKDYAFETAIQNRATRELPWYKNWSMRCVAFAACEYLARDVDISVALRQALINDPYDFLLRTKIPKTAKLLHGDVQIDNVSRYYISKTGHKLMKIMKPTGPLGTYKRAAKLTDTYYYSVINELTKTLNLNSNSSFEDILPQLPWDERINTKNKSKYSERITEIHSGYNVQICNNLDDFNVDDIDLDWYVKQVKKICNFEYIDNED